MATSGFPPSDAIARLLSDGADISGTESHRGTDGVKHYNTEFSEQELADVPINHLDYGYIGKCHDAAYLGKLIHLLRSGREGIYPDLERFAEERLNALDASHPFVQDARYLHQAQRQAAQRAARQQVSEFVAQTSAASPSQAHPGPSTSAVSSDPVPPVRGAGQTVKLTAKRASSGHATAAKGALVASSPAARDNSQHSASAVSTSSGQRTKRIPGHDFRGWDRYDVEAELRRLDEDEEDTGAKSNSHKDTSGKPAAQKPLGTSSSQPKGMPALHMQNIPKDARQRSKLAEHEKLKGNECIRSKDYEEAYIYYCRSLSLEETTAALTNRALASLKLKQFPQAEADCSRCLQIDPLNTKALLRRAQARFEMGHLQGCIDDASDVLNVNPASKDAKLLLAKAEERMGAGALSGADSSSKGTSNAAVSEGLEATSTARRRIPIEEVPDDDDDDDGDNDDDDGDDSGGGSEAVEIENEPCSTAQDRVSESAARRREDVTDAGCEEPASAPVSYTSDSVEPPARIVTLKEAGNEQFRLGQYGEAIESYTAALEDSFFREHPNAPLRYVLLSNRGLAFVKCGDASSAAEDLTKVLRAQPNDLKALMRRAQAYECLERFDSAHADYRAASALHPGMVAALEGLGRTRKMAASLGQALVSDTKPQTARSTVSSSSAPEASSQQRPARSVAPSTLKAEQEYLRTKDEGNQLFRAGKYAKATSQYSKCIALDPTKTDAFNNRAMCWMKQDQPAKALADCLAVLHRDGTNVKAYYRAAQAHLMLGSYQDGLIMAQRCVNLDPNNAAAHQLYDQLAKRHSPSAQDCVADKGAVAATRESPETSAGSQPFPAADSDAINPDRQSRDNSEFAHESSAKAVQAPSRQKTATMQSVNPPTTAARFLRLLERGNTDQVRASLSQVPVTSVRKWCNTQLEASHVLVLVEAICHADFDVERCSQLLDVLANAPRMDALLLFLEDGERALLVRTIQDRLGIGLPSSKGVSRLLNMLKG